VPRETGGRAGVHTGAGGSGGRGCGPGRRGGASAGSEPAPAALPVVTVLAAQETNWPGIVAEVTEFRRKGNTLTAKVRLRNTGSEMREPDVQYEEVYLMDAAAGKKYEVLQDEKGSYIAYLLPGWPKRWYGKIEAGQAVTLWMKFPAPPGDVANITLQLPSMAPFEDLAIQN
jgi:hypothetical protein